MFLRLFYLFIFILIVDTVNYLGLKAMMRRLRNSTIYKISFYTYFGLSAAVIISLFINLLIKGYPGLDYVKYRSYFFLFGVFLVIYLPRFIFFFFVIVQNSGYLVKSLLKGKRNYVVRRRKRKNYYIQKTGLLISFFSALLVIYGMVLGKSDFAVKRVDVYISQLPPSFDGFRIVQFSDAHLGSFTNRADVIKGLDMINSQAADIIVFTGDMVNNVADEMKDYIKDLEYLQAPYGKYAILGNHDMSDYVKWKDFEIKRKYIDKLVEYEVESGFKVLRNANVIIKKGGDSMALIGVDNWGLPPFKQYGDLPAAMRGAENVGMKILLSHDPTHWSEKVAGKSDIALTLSGHTHGGQIGFDLGKGIRFSPVRFKYKYWSGLYRQGENYLYVNPGFGYLGYPGRIGIRPQITLIVLHHKE